jgi:hypothetical protein
MFGNTLTLYIRRSRLNILATLGIALKFWNLNLSCRDGARHSLKEIGTTRSPLFSISVQSKMSIRQKRHRKRMYNTIRRTGRGVGFFNDQYKSILGYRALQLRYSTIWQRVLRYHTRLHFNLFGSVRCGIPDITLRDSSDSGTPGHFLN